MFARAVRPLSVVALAINLVACRFDPEAPGGKSGGAGGGGDDLELGPTLQTSDGVKYLAHEVIVKVQPGMGASEAADALHAALARVGGHEVAETGGGGAAMAALGYRRVSLPDSVTADEAISELTGTAGIARAERSFVVQAYGTTPNDPRYGELWGMAKIAAPAAWDTTTGAPEILVAVTDTGLDYTHPDLVANVWTNAGEIPGNGKDDDGNGWIDDIHGWDFANNDADPMDDHGHGTHCSGTIGGAGNNGVGVAGVNWRVKIQGVKFLGASGGGTLWNGAQTVLYAAKMKARVVSASWGCLGPGCYASYMEDALKTYAAAGGLFVAAAGNSANDNDAYPNYPSNYTVDNVVAVAATDSADKLASFSDWGATTVDLGAPGVGILSTLPGNSYASWSGTSMATPHVAGAAALFLAARPTATYLEVKQKLLETVDPIPALAGKTVSGGRLNLQKLIAAAGQPPAAPAGFQATPGDRSDVLLSWSANTEPDLAAYRVKWGTAAGVYTSTRDLTAAETSTRVIDLVHGTAYYFVVYARNASGLLSPASAEKRVVAQDRIAPPQVVDLAVSALPGAPAAGEVAEASGAFSPYWAAARAFDGAADTAWISPGRAETDQEFLTVRLYTPYLIDAVDLLPNPSYPAFFPVDFDVEISNDGEAWTAVGGLRNAAPAATETVRVAFPPALASLVRLRVLRAFAHESGLAYASIAEMTVQEASSAPDSLRVTFSAPGDDPGAGRAQSYDVRRATAPITDATFAAGTPVATGAPLAAGSPESFTVSGLADETTYYFAMKAVDEAGNLSPLSNVAGASTLVIPPSTITDLAVVDVPGGNLPGTVTLAWTAPGADGTAGQAASYDLRVSAAPLTAGGFAAADGVDGLPAPKAAGGRETFAVTGLAPGRTYWFALRATDGKGAVGGVSNVVVAVPASGADHTPPAAVKDLSIRLSTAGVKLAARIDSVSDELSAQRAAANLVDGDVATAWVSQAAAPAAPAWVVLDYGSVQPLVRFRTNPSTLDLVGSYPQDFEIQTSVDKLVWSPLVHVEGLTGQFASWNEWPTAVTYARYVRLYVQKRGPAAGTSVFAAMGELETYALSPSIAADLTWVAPGDDGYDGTAARYELRQSGAPITDDAGFAAATPVTTGAPLHGGFIEVVHLGALPPETTLYFAVRAIDADGNVGGLSNVVSLTTPGVPPAPVADLAVTGRATTALALSFTATGDDGTAGRAAAYDLRASKSPLSAQSWAAATPVTTGAPQAAGARETVNVTGLESSTVYYFAMKVIDDAGNASPLSNLASGSTLDGIAPARVTDLAVAPVDPTQRPALAITVIDSSGSYSAQTPATNLLDASAATAWVSPGTAGSTVVPMYVTFDLGGARRLGRLRLRAGAGYSDLFPPDFKLEVQATAGGAWKTILADSAVTTAGGWEEWLLGAVPAVTARLTVTKTLPWNGKLYTALGDVELYEDPADYGTLRLSWTAPGNDGASGTAASYDLRRDGQPITDASFGAATPVLGAPAPHPAGYLERLDATGLAAETTYCFALRATDDAGNVSPASSSPCATTPGMPPATVTDLAVTGATATTATLTFTAPGADGSIGTAAQYELRRSSARITTANWSAATVVSGLAAPHAAGTVETVTVTGLASASPYHFAIRATDAAGNVAAPSNDARGTTADDVAPARVTDLVASRVLSASGSLALSWTAPGDNGAIGTAQRYDVRASTTPITDAASFAAATPVSVPAPKAAGTAESALIAGLAAETSYYVALVAIDASGNAAPMSNVAQAVTREEAPSAIADLTVTGGTGPGVGQSTLVVQWTAPGDDGTTGTATRYDIRWSASAITAANFASASAASGAPAPAAAGTRQSHTVTGLAPGVKYYVAIVTADDRNNLSALSNVASGTTPDQMAPSTVSDLSASTGSSPGTLTVSLTAPGDDGASGTATSYDLRWGLNPLDATSFATAPALATPAPTAAGTRQTFTVTGLPNETVVYLALRARDDAGNLSALSNAATASTPDVAPGAVADLRQLSVGPGTVTVGWTAPGDDGSTGTAMAYDLRYAPFTITAATFAAATPASTSAPGAAGSAQSAVVTGLAANKTYSFAIKTRDERGNWSALSNVLAVDTEDTLAPATVTNLVATTGTAAGSILLRWTAPGDDGTTGTAKSYELRRSANAITAANWSAATVVAVAAPRVAGSAESATVTGLNGETTYHFALRAVDEAGNAAPISNDAAAATPAVAPAAVTNLAAALVINGTAASATLSWTAPGDDGTTGTATSYDLRYDTAPITASTFSTAQALSAAAPRAAGTMETASASGLREATTYYFALKAVDDTGTWSALSNVATVTVPDLTKPGAPASLSATTPDPAGDKLVVASSSVTASSSLGPSWQAANVADGDPSSAWSTAGSDTGAAAETLTLDLGASKTIDQIDLTPDARYLDLFPRDFSLAVSTDGTTWKTVATEVGFTVTSPGALEWGFAPVAAQQVRLTVTATGTSFGKHYAILADADVWAASATDGRAQLTWVAPGDDGQTGTATRYQVYKSTSAFTEAQVVAGALNPISGSPTPLAAGLLQTMLVTSLAGETTYYWAVRAVDEASNAGTLSAVVAAKTNDVPPAPVSTLAARATSTTDVQLDWKATGSDAAAGTAASVELRYLPGALHARNFASATLVAGVPAPASAGTAQSVVVHGLTPGVSYHFALVAKDAAGNASPLSNVAVAATQALPDTTPPAAVADLSVALPAAGGQLVTARAVTTSSEQIPGFAAANLIDGDRNAFWATAARTASQLEWARVEVPAETAAGRIRVWPADNYADLFPPDFSVRVSRDGLAWTTVYGVTGYVAVPGQPVTIDLPASTTLRYVELRALRLPSRGPSAFYAAAGELEVFSATAAAGTAVVSWTAPADDGPAGRPASYDLRAGACPFDATTATTFTAPAPSAPGSPERARLTGLRSGTTCVAVRSTDAAGNASAWSNVATIVVP